MAAPLAPRDVRVAVVGLGNMGRAIAERLLDAGYPVAVFNRTPERASDLVGRGAAPLGSPARALADADACLTSLADDAAVERVVLGDDGVLAGASPGSLLVEASTISVAASTRVAEAAADAGVRYLRAPLSGNPTAVRGGKAAVVVSGPEEAAREAEQLLAAVAPAFRYVGEGERARVLKLALQIMIGGTVELLAEALVLAEAAGVPRGVLLEVVGASVVGSSLVEYKTEPLLGDDFSATFTTAMLGKDIDLVLDLADEVRADLPLARELRSLVEAACEAGHAEKDFVSLVLPLRERAGVARAATGRGDPDG